ncbi:MAG: hypothetical protein SGJ13_04240, partial [Actinomycetota bacterium]|nr:hypothetical protein [Actinomycetota bacterium]
MKMRSRVAIVVLIVFALLAGSALPASAGRISISPRSSAVTPGPCTRTYDGPNNGSWGTAANWDTNVLPGDGDVACVPAGLNVNLSSAVSVGAINIAGRVTISSILRTTAPSRAVEVRLVTGSLVSHGELSITGSLAWLGGTISGDGSVTIETTATSTWSTAAAKTLSTTFVNNSLTDWTGGNLALTSAAHIDNRLGFLITSDAIMSNSGGGANPKLTNTSTGFITKNNVGVLQLQNVDIDNAGTVSIADGRLELSTNGSDTLGGRWEEIAGFTLVLVAGDYTFTDSVNVLGFEVDGADVVIANTADFRADHVEVFAGSLQFDSPDNDTVI